MGFCRGTSIFDEVVGEILDDENFSKEQITKVVTLLINSLESMDWDCQADSCYYNNPIVKDVFRAIHPNWFEETDE